MNRTDDDSYDGPASRPLTLSDVSGPSVNIDGMLQRFADGMPDPMFFKDLRHRWVAVNQAFCDLLGRPAEVILGKSDPDFFPPDQVTVFWAHDDRVFSTGKGDLNEEKITRADGSVQVLWTRKTAVYGEGRAVVGLCGIIMDITEQQAHLRQVERLEASAAQREAIIRAQQRTIDELVVPVLEVWDGILLLPLVGALSRGRAGHAIDSALMAVGRYAAEVVIIDVTGSEALDASVAELLVRATQAVALLGCKSILVGISPEAAQALVAGGTDLRAMKTCATLKQGLSLALSQRRGERRRG